MKLTPNQYRKLHSTRVTIFTKLKREAVERQKELQPLNEGATFSIFKALDGENKGKWCLHIINEEGVKYS